jgi:hypothetical protein
LCNFFQTHIKNFAIIAAPLFKLTRKDSGYKGSPLPKEAMDAFYILKNSLVSEPVMAFPRADRQYALITNAATGTANTAGGLGTILSQKDQFDNSYAISYASRQLKNHEKNYSPFLLESAAVIWGMDVFNEYLKRKNSSYSLAFRKDGTSPHKNNDPSTSRTAGTGFCHPVQERCHHAS